MLTIALIGRPNVGKSTLYNRLAGKREAIVHNEPGVTRDRKYGEGSIGPLTFRIIDTPGLEDLGKTSLAGRMSAQSFAALEEADLIFFIVDGRSGITPEDEQFARQLRKLDLPIIVIANKAENTAITEPHLLDAYRLGFGDAIPISAEHGEGLQHLYDALVERSDEPLEEEPEANFLHDEGEEDETWLDRPITLAVLGRPNVGKSTLINSLLGTDRVLTGPEAGMTRDSVTITMQWNEREFHLVDTAGLCKKSRISESLEQLSVSSTLQALRFADVAVLMLDATMPLEKQDNTIAGLIEREGRACVIALNKADHITVDEAYVKAFEHRLRDVVPHMRGIAIVPMVATTGKGMDELMQRVIEAYRIWNKRIPTAQLNSWLQTMIEYHSPPLVNNRRLKFRYMTQTKSRPPTFVIFANKSKEVPASYTRFLTNQLRKDFELPGTPIRFLLRTGKNPYVK